jgi:hypothetical protein
LAAPDKRGPGTLQIQQFAHILIAKVPCTLAFASIKASVWEDSGIAP